MSAEQPVSNSAPDDEALLLAFERAWEQQSPPDWFEYCKAVSPPIGRLPVHLQLELAAIDLELCWKRGMPRYVETYLDQAPELLDQPCLLQLVAEEYRVRRRFQTDFAQNYQDRFPGLRSAIDERLRIVDMELKAEKNRPHPRSDIKLANTSATKFVRDNAAKFTDRDFLLERFIGSGAVGKVYRAKRLDTQSTVAIKYLKKSFQHQPMLVERFLYEAKIVSQLEHPRIVSHLGLGQTNQGGYFVVFNWYQAGDLGRRINVELPDVADAVRWTHDAVTAIDYAHEHQVVHCDLKPGNLLLDKDGNAVVADFGLARSTADTHLERTLLEGTIGFMAPEQACSSFGDIGPWTDVYGLGAVLYTLLTGKSPYCERRPSDSLGQLLAGRPFPAPTSLRTSIPRDVELICLDCLSRDPSKRPSTAREVMQRLSEIRY